MTTIVYGYGCVGNGVSLGIGIGIRADTIWMYLIYHCSILSLYMFEIHPT